jgi:peptide/nickel transport system permease protein
MTLTVDDPKDVRGRLKVIAGVARAGRTRRSGSARWELRIGATLLTVMILACVFVPIFSSYGVNSFVGVQFQGPSGKHWFGTDSYGRDVFVRVFAGGRLDIFIALVGVLVPMTVGSLIGVLVGASRSKVLDTIVMRILDAIISIPFIILVLALTLVIGAERSFGPLPAGLPALLIAVFSVGWAVYARLARGQTLALRDADYIVATRMLGYSRARVVLRHILPVVILTTATYAAGDAILIIAAVAGLAFLGAGVPPPAPEWGNMIYQGRSAISYAWWDSVFPGVILTVTGLGFALIADVLVDRRDADG